MSDKELLIMMTSKCADLERQLEEALKLADEAIQHYGDSSNYSDQFFYDVSVMLGDSLKEQLKEKGE